MPKFHSHCSSGLSCEQSMDAKRKKPPNTFVCVMFTTVLKVFTNKCGEKTWIIIVDIRYSFLRPKCDFELFETTMRWIKVRRELKSDTLAGYKLLHAYSKAPTSQLSCSNRSRSAASRTRVPGAFKQACLMPTPRSVSSRTDNKA